MRNLEAARQKLDGMLKVAGLPLRPSYYRPEACAILHISERIFWRYVPLHEITEAGHAVKPWPLDSYMTRGHYRVRHDELVSWLARNRTYERNNAPDPMQTCLSGF